MLDLSPQSKSGLNYFRLLLEWTWIKSVAMSWWLKCWCESEACGTGVISWDGIRWKHISLLEDWVDTRLDKPSRQCSTLQGGSVAGRCPKVHCHHSHFEDVQLQFAPSTAAPHMQSSGTRLVTVVLSENVRSATAGSPEVHWIVWSEKSIWTGGGLGQYRLQPHLLSPVWEDVDDLMKGEGGRVGKLQVVLWCSCVV